MHSSPSLSQYFERDLVAPDRSKLNVAQSNIQNSERRSIARRVSRAFARYSIVFLIGIGVTLAWQSYGDKAIEMVRTEAPSLAWLLPVSTAKPHPDGRASVAAVVISAELDQQLGLWPLISLACGAA